MAPGAQIAGGALAHETSETPRSMSGALHLA